MAEEIPYEKLKRMYKLLSEANNALQSELDKLRQEVVFLRNRSETNEIDKMKQNGIIQKTLTDHNAKMDAVIRENQKLKEELRKLRNGN